MSLGDQGPLHIQGRPGPAEPCTGQDADSAGSMLHEFLAPLGELECYLRQLRPGQVPGRADLVDLVMELREGLMFRYGRSGPVGTGSSVGVPMSPAKERRVN